MTEPDIPAKRRILFVDDEQSILEGLRNRLRRKRDQWEMHFALGGKEALLQLLEQPFDVIVTDMRMPGMDGAALLREVQSFYPDVVRIVLSGHAEFEAALRAVPVAHQFLAKPCDPGVLENVVERACQLQRLVNDATVRAIVGKVSALPAMPQLYSKLQGMLVDDRCAMADIADVIKQDTGMCAKILQLVNSAFFRLSRPLSRIEDAIGYLGLEAVHRVVLASELFDAKRGSFGAARELQSLRTHSLVTATLASQLLPEKKQQEDTFIAALLHDIGKLLIAVHLPEHHQAAVAHAESKGVGLHAAEMALSGVSHAEVGAYLLGIWGLPYFIVEAVANHHEPGRVDEATFGVLGAVHVGDVLAHALMDQSNVEPDPAYAERVGIAGRWSEWKARFGDQVAEIGSRLGSI
jgi:putative nucleotidyltransferase with HDIG domain